MTHGWPTGSCCWSVAVTTAICTPLFRRLAIRIGAVVAPDERRVHERPTPLLGGAAMLVGFLVGVVVAWRLDVLSAVFSETTEPRGVVIAAVLMLAVGTLDDLREVSAPAKVAGIVLCASVLVYFGVSMLVLPAALRRGHRAVARLVVPHQRGVGAGHDQRHQPDRRTRRPGRGHRGHRVGHLLPLHDAAHPDGVLLDGSIAPLRRRSIVLGMCVGFLPCNFHPARIFMGDGGALLLGLLMAASTMVGRAVAPARRCSSAARPTSSSPRCSSRSSSSACPSSTRCSPSCGGPRKRSGVASADKEHIHHRLMRLGHGQRRSVLILWALDRRCCR